MIPFWGLSHFNAQNFVKIYFTNFHPLYIIISSVINYQFLDLDENKYIVKRDPRWR